MKRTAQRQFTERWPAVVPTAYAMRQRRPPARWSDADIIVAALSGAVAALVVTTVLALMILAVTG